MSGEFAEGFVHSEVLTDTSVDRFITDFGNIEAGRRFRIPAIPVVKQAKMLTTLPSEITVLQLPTDETRIVKGLGRAKTALTRGELLQLKPKIKIHTHPLQEPNPDKLSALLARAELDPAKVDSRAFGRIARIMPSPEDFTLGGTGAERDEIWTEMGRTRFRTYSAQNETSLMMALQIAGGVFSSKEYIATLADESLSIQEKIAKLNAKLGVLGVSFDFTSWEELEK
jgi:hypothetical protein